MSPVEVRELAFASPLRARSLLTVRAAISSARFSETPCLRSLSFMCSYWRSRLLPFLTPRGGISSTSDQLLVFRGRAQNRAPDALKSSYPNSPESIGQGTKQSDRLVVHRNPSTS